MSVKYTKHDNDLYCYTLKKIYEMIAKNAEREYVKAVENHDEVEQKLYLRVARRFYSFAKNDFPL